VAGGTPAPGPRGGAAGSPAGAGGGRPLAVLESEICLLAGHLAAATCRFLVLLAEFDARRGWAAWDMPSCAAWLSWKCQLASGTAREHVRVARALAGLPVIRGEFAAGRLSFAKVRALTRIADAGSDADLAEMAGPMTANQLERFARAHRTVTRNMDEQARLHRRLTWRRAVTQDTAPDHDDHGGVSAATLPAGPAEGTVGVSAGTRPTSTCLADALVQIAEAYIAGKTRDAANPDVYQVIIHATPDALIPDSVLDGPDPAGPDAAAPEDAADGTAAPAPDAVIPHSVPDRTAAEATAVASSPGTAPSGPGSPPSPSAGRGHLADRHAPGGLASRCHVEDGPAVSKQALQRIACDAVWSWISHNQQGDVLNVGRRRREPTPAIRRALRERDKCRCRFPGCHRRATQAHHIRWWLYDGETSLDNLISMCSYHHRLIHQHGYQIATPAPGVFTFYRPDGKQIPDSPPLPEPHGQLHEQHDAQITADTIIPPWYGERLDLDYAIAVLFGNQKIRQQRQQHQEAALAA
jgi:hypothetical protein